MSYKPLLFINLFYEDTSSFSFGAQCIVLSYNIVPCSGFFCQMLNENNSYQLLYSVLQLVHKENMALKLAGVQVEYFDVHHICKVCSLFELVTEKLLSIMRSLRLLEMS